MRCSLNISQTENQKKKARVCGSSCFAIKLTSRPHLPTTEFLGADIVVLVHLVRMKFSYQLSNVLGSVYHSGSLEFTSNGSSFYSPVGNKVVRYDLKSSSSCAVPVELEYNIAHVACSPNGTILLLATEKTQLYLYSLVANRILHRKHFHDLGQSITALGFSSCGRYYIVCGGNRALIYITPGTVGRGSVRCLSPFQIHKVIKANFDEVTCFDFSSDSKLVVIGSDDMSLKVSAVDTRIKNVPYIVSLSGHSDKIVNCFFKTEAGDSLDIVSLSANGHVIFWKCNINSSGLIIEEKKNILDHESGDNTTIEKEDYISYAKESRFYLIDHLKALQKDKSTIKLTCSDYNYKSKLLTTGYSNGSFLINSIAELDTPIYSLQLSTNSPLESMRINSTGDWIAMGSGIGEKGTSTQLVVWEWKSETFLLKQSGTGAGLVNLTECVAFSPDSSYLASGSNDGKIKLWNLNSGFNFATFGSEHRGPITDLKFVPNKGGKVLVSASLDGTVRCFDMGRYRNFRTFTGPSEEKSAQFTCLAIDPLSGDFIAAGSQNLFDIFLWSQETGKLIEILSGHSAPVSGLAFSPTNNFLASTSWDGTVRIWDLFQGTKSTREVIKLSQPGISLAMNTSGSEIAVSLLDGKIAFFNPITGDEVGSAIEGRNDLGINQEEEDISRNRAKHFSTLEYSVDGKFCHESHSSTIYSIVPFSGNYIIAAGNSKYVCIYHIKEKLMVKKFAITWNLSMDGMYDWISKRKKAEFGFNASQIKSRDGESDDSHAITLPGVRKGDLSERSVNPVILVTSVTFCPTMRSFAISSSEGVMLFSLDVNTNFDPYQLEINITEDSVRESLERKDYADALMQSLKLNQDNLIREVIESVPVDQIAFISSGLNIDYFEKLLNKISSELESSAHLQFYLMWVNQLLKDHAVVIKSKHNERGSLISVLRHVQKSIQKHENDLGKLCDYNKYMLKFIIESSAAERASSSQIEDESIEMRE